jgi:hypothetical protein
MKTIDFESGVQIITMNEKEVKKLYEDVQFLEEVIISLLNPEFFNRSSSFATSSEDIKFELRRYFNEKTSFNKETIYKAFNREEYLMYIKHLEGYQETAQKPSFEYWKTYYK